MTRSEPPQLTTDPGPNRTAPKRPILSPLTRRFVSLVRCLHLYLSMVGLAVVLFFSLTGLTLNHPDWFAANSEHRTEVQGQLDPAWLSSSSVGGDASGVARLEIVEHLRRTHGVRGALVDFRVDDQECLVTFKAPAYSADAIIERPVGRYGLTQTSHGLVAFLNDLHKGRDSGQVWSILIDVSAILLTIISVTGLLLLLTLKRRRSAGLWIGLAGTLAFLVFLWLLP